MRKLLFILFVILSLVIVTGCGGSSEETQSDKNPGQGITVNKYSKGGSGGKSSGSIKNVKPSNQNKPDPQDDQTGASDSNNGTDDPKNQTDDSNQKSNDEPNDSSGDSNEPQDEQENQPVNGGTNSNEQDTQPVENGSQPPGPGSLPCRFYGVITIDGSPAPADTLVEAYVDSELVDEWQTKGFGYKLEFGGNYPGENVSIHVNGVTAGETPWEKGGNINYDISIP